MKLINRMKLEFDAISINEAFARSVAAAFCVTQNPDMEDINDIKTAVSEAVTNAIVHGYEKSRKGIIILEAELYENQVKITIEDTGKGIENIEEAMQPFYTSKPEDERSGMGFTVMQTFMSSLNVTSEKNKGTKIVMTKKFNDVSEEN